MTEHRESGHDQSAGDRDVVPLPARVRLDILDPSRDPVRFQEMARDIATRAIAERVRNTPERTPVVQRTSAFVALASWSRPAIAAAALVLVAATATLVLFPTRVSAAPRSLAESAGLPAPLVDWSARGVSPSLNELVDAFGSAAGPGRAP
jgi:hypothetical protein